MTPVNILAGTGRTTSDQMGTPSPSQDSGVVVWGLKNLCRDEESHHRVFAHCDADYSSSLI